jgi:hypothetical protein
MSVNETHYAGSYWLARPEPVEACAHRLEDFLRRVAPLERTWDRWHETANTFKTALRRRIALDAPALVKLLSKKSNRFGDDSSYWLWTGESEDETSGFSGHCGSAHTRVGSHCILNALGQKEVAKRVVTAPVLTEVVRAMVFAWEPEFAIATSDQHVDLVVTEQFPKLGTYVGWIMYFADFRGPVPPLPEPVRVEHIPDRGSLITLTQEKFTASNPAHVALAADVQARLKDAGLLVPLRPWGTATQSG